MVDANILGLACLIGAAVVGVVACMVAVQLDVWWQRRRENNLNAATIHHAAEIIMRESKKPTVKIATQPHDLQYFLPAGFVAWDCNPEYSQVRTQPPLKETQKMSIKGLLFGKKYELQGEIDKLTDEKADLKREIDRLEDSRKGANVELENLRVKVKTQKEDLEATHKRQTEDLAAHRKREMETVEHLVKIRDEKREIEYQKREQKSDRERDTAIAAVRDTYRDKLEKELTQRAADLREMYEQILARLPDINVALTGKVGGRAK